uniref:Ty3 transposon capsid-like protein domain-containing protein n=1 Tax=Cajanus cajan TaxID=3821 RepID=A0A151UA23_CAJCA|nr:hypothetical protein KK1_020272 [Cajanus cajan]
MKLRQKKSVIEYYEEFDAIITRLNLSEEYLLSYFLGGLKKDIQMMVRMFQPTTVNKAFSLARLYEAANTSGSVSNEINKQQKGVLGHRPLSVDNSSSSSTGTNASRIKARSGKSLTPAYMDERRAKGLCYFCDDPYSPEHSLTHKKLQVHVLEMDLMKLRQKKSVIEYYEEFDAIITRLNLSEEYLLSYFLGGLKKDIQMMVRMFQPTTVNKAFSLARLYEATNTSGSVINEININSKKGYWAIDH